MLLMFRIEAQFAADDGAAPAWPRPRASPFFETSLPQQLDVDECSGDALVLLVIFVLPAAFCHPAGCPA
jgi:hypothetical protein